MGWGPAEELPGALRAFLHDRIESVEQLDVLMALHRTGRAADAGQIARELGLSESSVGRSLERLAGQGLLEAKLGGEAVWFRYDPLSTDLSEAVDLLAGYYASSRTAVVQFVTTHARQALRDFAAAFRLRGSQ